MEIDPVIFGMVVGFLILVNILSFLMVVRDKMLSQRKGVTKRIAEGVLFFLSAFFGSVGIYAGMVICRHKMKKWYFMIGIPLLMVQNCAFVYVIYLWFSRAL